MLTQEEKLLKKARLMREEFNVLMQSEQHPYVEIDRHREVELDLMPSYRTKMYIYEPSRDTAEKLPAYVCFHSGAWVRGSARFDDYRNRVTANKVNCVVISVDYQLAPEIRFPNQPNECYEAVKWVFQNADELGIDTKRIAVGGHNTGATIAAVVSHLARDKGEFMPRCIVLDCPMMDISTALEEMPDFDLDEPLKGPMRAAFFNYCYLGDMSLQKDPLASPNYEKNLEGLAPTFVIGASLDPMVKFSDEYYKRLVKAGNDCRAYCHEGQKHSFNIQPGLATPEAVDKAFEVIDEYLIEAFSAPATV